ncbi:MAG: MCE family protein [Rhodospirillaceae bacterium]|jgi:phospholipid/cholesterol/gamma-HCH transport system substrate-binding protein|nr:MCE family protein [Rhodospirillaceae bacterium]
MNVSESKSIVVGAVMVIVFALVFVVLPGGHDAAKSAADGSYTIEAVFNRVDGLVEGDEVHMGGVRIGSVTSQRLDENYRAIVSLTMKTDVKLPTDTSAAIHTDGLFGSKYITLEPGGDEEYLTDGGVITFTQDALVVSELLDLIIAEGKKQAKEAKAAKAQVKEAHRILGKIKGAIKGDE